MNLNPEKFIHYCWIGESASLKFVLENSLGCSGQLLKKYFSRKQQSRVVKSREVLNLPLELVNHYKINPGYNGPNLKIIFENEDLIAIHKPSLIHCHPHSYSDQNTILNFLVMINKWESLLINTQAYDRGLLYRLDYETSGVIILAKKISIFKSIRDDFGNKRKFYWAIVEGNFNQEGDWKHYFESSGKKGMKQKVFNSREESTLEGELLVVKIMHQHDKSLLLIKLETGIRHQIRAQLAHLGFPILGDVLYGGASAQRLFLHALRYEIPQIIEDPNADLFNLFFDLNRALQMTHDMLRRF